VAAEFARENDKGAVEQFAGLEIADELGDGAVDLLFHVHEARVAVLVGVPIEEGDVFGGDFDEAGADLAEAAGEQATEAEAASVIYVVILFGLEGEVEGFGRGRTE